METFLGFSSSPPYASAPPSAEATICSEYRRGLGKADRRRRPVRKSDAGCMEKQEDQPVERRASGKERLAQGRDTKEQQQTA